MSAARYLNELIDYGGIPTTRSEAILDMRRIGATQPMIDRWLQGYELAQRLRERRARLTSRIFLAETPTEAAGSAADDPKHRTGAAIASVRSHSTQRSPRRDCRA